MSKEQLVHKAILSSIFSLIDKHQKTYLDKYKLVFDNFKSDEDVMSSVNQDVIIECINIAISYFFEISQTEKFMNAVISLIDKKYVQSKTVQTVLQYLHSYLNVENVYNNIKIVMFSVQVIRATFPFKISNDCIMENVHLLIDFYTIIPSNSQYSKLLYRCIQEYIVVIFTVHQPQYDGNASPLFGNVRFSQRNIPITQLELLSSTRNSLSPNALKELTAAIMSDETLNSVQEPILAKPASPSSSPFKDELGELKEEQKSEQNTPKEEIVGDKDGGKELSKGSPDKQSSNDNTPPQQPSEAITEEEKEVDVKLDEMKRRSKEQTDEKETVDVYPPYLLLLKLLTKNGKFSHGKVLFLSTTLNNSDWRSLRGKGDYAKKMEKMVLNLVGYWLEKCPKNISPNNVKGWNVDICKCIFHNAFSSDKLLFYTSLKIFSVLVHKYRFELKKEIGLLFKYVYLFYLKSPLAMMSYKDAIIDEFCKFSTQPDILFDLFANYDCEKNGLPILEEYLDVMHFVLSVNYQKDITDDVGPKAVHITRKKCYKIVQNVIEVILHKVQSVQKNEKFAEDENEENKTLIESVLKQRQDKVDNAKAIQLFNERPNDGIAFMVSHKLCEEDPKSVALYLSNNEALDKTSLGKYLTGNKEFQKNVFKEFVGAITFTGLSVDEALRKMFRIFVMPGEGQIVDRVIETFSLQYYKSNKEKMDELKMNETQIYFLSTTIIFLSTETHNANVKTKTMDTYEKFKEMVEQFKFTLPDDYLHPLYDCVIQNAFLFPEEKKQNGDVYINLVKNSPNKREDLLSLTSGFESIIGMHTSPPIRTFSFFSKNLLIAFIEAAIPPILESLKIAFLSFGTFEDVLKHIKTLLGITTLLSITEHTKLIVKTLCEWSFAYRPSNTKKENVLVSKLLLEKVVLYKEQIKGGWVHIFAALSKLQEVNLVDKPQLPPLLSLPKNTRKLFFMEVKHVLYSPIETKQIPITMSDLNYARKELKILLDVEKTVFDQIVTFSPHAFCSVFYQIKTASLEALNQTCPSLYLLIKVGYILFKYKTINKVLPKEIAESTSELLLQAALHPHEDVAKEAVKIYFVLTENGVFDGQCERLRPMVVAMCDSPISQCRLTILEMLKTHLEKHTKFIEECWKGVFAMLYIGGIDENMNVLKQGYDVLKYVSDHYSHFEEECVYYYLKTMVKYSLVANRTITQDKESHPFVIGNLQKLLDDQKFEGIIQMDSKFADIFFNVLKSYVTATSSIYIDIASLSLQSIIQVVSDYSERMSPEVWYFVFNEIFFKILESIGYVHHTTHPLTEIRSTEWITSVCLNLLLQVTGLISRNSGMLSLFTCDYVYVITSLVIRGTELISQIGLLALKDIIPFFIDHVEQMQVFELMNIDVLNYFFDATLSFTIQQEHLLKEIEKSEQTNISVDQKQNSCCSNCHKELKIFETIECPLCNLQFCSLKCKKAMEETHKHVALLKDKISDRFVTHDFEMKRIDVPFVTTTFQKYISTIEDFIPQLVSISTQQSETILSSLIFNTERFLNVLVQTKPTHPYYDQLVKVTTRLELFLMKFTDAVFKKDQDTFIKFLDKLVAMPSLNILNSVFRLLNICDDEHLKKVKEWCIIPLYKLVMHDDHEIRKSLSSLLIKLHEMK
ncbi:guanyl-nucleotide exchange factor, putative [Entamoeba invadens IP1]|uniref:guanyl-nucleotide exchange factor, putative n=1 Tax=Entamoeba invadens IP1 TaxID=370355 RepID=UPI0002C3D925|nr:guanyl-nucleotide exchange factor, putative [Entamoeba invadens IP1]ELP93156.1 guanyl-nucleotide exchange factor, putative [Entamoeba invadens IP1]|eukprot:XP_004259927.1 guanyl-nucleotide exchange factor, putative [Entamoeba invadens IP1]